MHTLMTRSLAIAGGWLLIAAPAQAQVVFAPPLPDSPTLLMAAVGIAGAGLVAWRNRR